MTTTQLRDFVGEAFIDPIRSVLIVDDQYPTWEEVLNERLPDGRRDRQLEAQSASKVWRLDPIGTLGVIGQFRKRKPALIIDVYDCFDEPPGEQAETGREGQPNLARSLDRLHQSDLLILDYNLEGVSSGLEGALARDILRSVLQNRHFNLVVVHTQEADLEEVFWDCVISLSVPLDVEKNEKVRALVAMVQDHLDELSDDEIFFRSDFNKYFDLNSYIRLRHPSTDYETELREYMKGSGALRQLHDWADVLGLQGQLKKGFGYWSIREFEKACQDRFADSGFAGLSWTLSSDRLWLRTSRGFVTIVSKEQQDLLLELQLSLQAWQPSPSRLLSAKVRHEVSRNGVEAEDRTLSKSHLFSYFYDLIRNSGSESTRTALIRDHLGLQSEALTAHIESSVFDFGERILKAEREAGESFSTHYGVDLTDEQERRLAASHFNSYVSTLPMIDDCGHLDCGHVFRIRDEWWVCATPTCDMQPGQNTIAFIGHSDELRPFTAVRLEEMATQALTNRHVNTGLYCFVEFEPGRIQILGPHLGGPEESIGPGSQKVTWRVFIAKNDGRYVSNSIDLIRPKLNAGSLEMGIERAHVVSKLRYEYALNYVQKVGGSVTRIGLGYRGDDFSPVT